MKDCREELVRKIAYIISEAPMSKNEMAVLRNKILVEINRYDVKEKSTELMTRDETSEALIRLYIGWCKVEGKSDNTIKMYAWFLMKFIAEIDVPLIDARPINIMSWLLNKQNTISLRSCENYRSYLSAFYTWATNEGILQNNPMSKISPIDYEDVIPFAFSDVDIDELRSSCKSLRDRAELEVLLSCGARVSELCQMNKSDINFDTKEVLIRKGKGSKQRVTFVNDVCLLHLRRYLNSRKDSDPALFTSMRKKRISKGTVERDLRNMGHRVDIDKSHPHRCRRTLATNLAENGMDLVAIQSILGHRNLNTTQKYISHSSSFVRNEYERFA